MESQQPKPHKKRKTKRGHGEGTICKRQDGRWCGAISLAPYGKRKFFYGETREEVAKKLTRAMHEHQQGLPLPDEKQTVGQFLDRWLEDSAKPTVRPKTYDSYAQLVRLHLRPGLGHHRLAKLSPAHVQKFMNDKLAAGLSARSVQYLRAILRRALGQALKWRIVAINAATLVDAPKGQRPEVNPFTPDEARAFLKTIKGDRLEALFTCALASPSASPWRRPRRWDDIDLQARTLTVRANLQRIDHKLQLVEPKTRRSRRTLTLPETTAAALRAHRTRQLEEKVKAGERWHDTGFVFTSAVGTPLEPRNVVRRFHAILEEAKLRHQRFHDLRHCAATLLLAQGVELRTIMEILGHSQISITADLYTHVIPAVKREAADLMDGILSAKK